MRVLSQAKCSGERICICTWHVYLTADRGNLETWPFMVGKKLYFYLF